MTDAGTTWQVAVALVELVIRWLVLIVVSGTVVFFVADLFHEPNVNIARLLHRSHK